MIVNENLSNQFELPRTEFFLIQCKNIELKLIEWYKNKHYSQGDDYSVRITNKGKFEVSYSNDYPMQHGSGKRYILTENDFTEAMAFKN
jgi:hypothetical protein